MPVSGARRATSARSVAPVTSKAAALQLDFLKKSNKKLDQILKDNPGVKKFLERNAAAIATPKAGDVQTVFDWPVWTHSPKSGGLTKANENDIIVVWQESSKSKIDFGGYTSFQGEIIAIQRVNLRDTGPVSPWTAIDQGYIWPNMTVTATGAKGKAAKMKWAVVTIDASGNARGGGWPSGYAGRSFDGVHGSPAYIPLKS